MVGANVEKEVLSRVQCDSAIPVPPCGSPRSAHPVTKRILVGYDSARRRSSASTTIAVDENDKPSKFNARQFVKESFTYFSDRVLNSRRPKSNEDKLPALCPVVPSRLASLPCAIPSVEIPVVLPRIKDSQVELDANLVPQLQKNNTMHVSNPAQQQAANQPHQPEVDGECRPVRTRNSVTTGSAGIGVKLYELIADKLYLTFMPSQEHSKRAIKARPDLFFFSSALHEQYVPFALDFGPVNLATVIKFWRHVRSKETHPGLGGRPLVYYCDPELKHMTNAAFLLGTYMMVEHGMSAEAATGPFQAIKPYPFMPFRDATFAPPTFGLRLADCLLGVQRAMGVGWLDAPSFDCDEYEGMEDPMGGDMHRIGDKFVAFRGPVAPNLNENEKVWGHCPGFYATKLKAMGVTAVVRLNEASSYDAQDFRRAGINHYELEFLDCSAPSPDLVRKFLHICDQEPGLVAVHCKAGLGRTGTMIALWMMKHRGFSGREAIGWLRVCRAGSVIGMQQQFLVDCDKHGWQQDDPYTLVQVQAAGPGVVQQGRRKVNAIRARMAGRGLGRGSSDISDGGSESSSSSSSDPSTAQPLSPPSRDAIAKQVADASVQRQRRLWKRASGS